MAKFKYRAMGSEGNKITGDYEAASKDEVIAMITSNGYYPLMVQQIEESTKIEFNLFAKVTTKDIAIFCRQLYTMLDVGVSINKALNIMSGQIENKLLKEAVKDIEERVKKGEMLSEAMKKHQEIFPKLLIAMVQSGEISGNLDTMMLRMSNHYEKDTKINNKIKSAMIYPAVLSLVAVVAIMFIMIYVMPTFIEMFESEGVNLPFTTKMLLGLSGFLSNNLLLILILTITIYVLFTYYKRTDQGIYTLSNLKLKLPVIGKLNKKIIVSRFTRTLSTLIASGVSLIHALPVVGEVLGNKVAEDALLKIKEEVVKGSGLSGPIRECGIFPEMLSSMVTIGEETGQLDEILNKTADFYDEEVEQAIIATTSLLEPILIVVMGVIIGFIVISVMLPMFDMYTAM